MPEAIVDACCLINLYATGEFDGFLRATDFTWHVPSAAVAESLYICTTNEKGQPDREPIRLQTFVGSGLIDVCAPQTTEEIALYVQLAADLDDGEAMALAVAGPRGWMLATDDRKARRFADQLTVPVMTTPELMKRWAAVAGFDPSTIRRLLHNIEERGRFVPAEKAPAFDWWTEHLA